LELGKRERGRRIEWEKRRDRDVEMRDLGVKVCVVEDDEGGRRRVRPVREGGRW